MVRSSMSDEERQAWMAVLKGGFIMLVAGSAALIAVQGGAELLEIAGVTLFGAVFGALLLWYLTRMGV